MGITSTADGLIWVMEQNGNRIVRVRPSGEITGYAIPTPNSRPFSIQADPFGRLWFTEYEGNNLGMLDPRSGLVTEYPLPAAGSAPTDATYGPDGRIWVVERGSRGPAT